MDIDVERLTQLQHLDTELRHASLFLDNIPRLIEDIGRKIESGSSAVAAAKDKLVQNQKKRRELEAQVKDIKVQVVKYKRQLNEVKTNKEYTALLKEIEDTQHGVDTTEEQIIGEMLVADDIEEEIKAAVLRQGQEEESLRKERDALLHKKKEMEDKQARLLAEKEALLPLIPAEQIRLYLTISAKKNGVAMSLVRGDFCAMCHMRIRPQMLNEIRDRTKLHLCENCGRILYWTTSPEVKAE